MTSKHLARLTLAAATALLAFALLAPSASARETAPGYERFAGCPSIEENIAAAEFCTRTVITGGHFKMGNKDVPITNPMTLVGGLTESGEIAFNSKGGLSKAKQKVPGGVIGLTGLTWLFEFLGSEALTLYATTELAGKPFLKGGGEEVELPVKVHLENTALGNNCYVGSSSNPIKLHLTWGTTSPPAPNKPITGVEPVPGKSDLANVLLFEKGLYVDNSFAAPSASGCVLTLFGFIPISINGLVNEQSGLPAAAGTNETKQNFNLEITAGAGVVYPF
jgi:hypothetical protein